MSKISKSNAFLIFFIEQYAKFHDMKGEEVFQLLEKHHLIEYILSMNELYHIEAIENAIEDIDSKIS